MVTPGISPRLTVANSRFSARLSETSPDSLAVPRRTFPFDDSRAHPQQP
jgi:hypothetical protein